MLKSILDHPAEFNPSLLGFKKLVPILERMDIQPRGEEQADRVGDQLLVGVEVLAE